MKYKYLLKVNCDNDLKKGKEFEFSFQHTKHIIIKLAKEKYTVTAFIGRYYQNTDNYYLINLMKEGIKRAMFLHLFLYASPVNNQKFSLSLIDGDEREQSVDVDFMPFSMITEKLLRPIPDKLKTTVFLQNAMNALKSEKGSENAALVSYLYSKSRIFETERFQFLWMAFNGFYSTNTKSKIDKDNIERLLGKYELGKEILGRKERDRLDKSPLVIMKDIKEKTFINDIRNENSDTYKIIKHYIDKHMKKNITVEGYIVGDFSYHLRCTLFHANRPIQLIAFENDLELKCLRLANSALERFLDEHLIDIFDKG